MEPFHLSSLSALILLRSSLSWQHLNSLLVLALVLYWKIRWVYDDFSSSSWEVSSSQMDWLNSLDLFEKIKIWLRFFWKNLPLLWAWHTQTWDFAADLLGSLPESGSSPAWTLNLSSSCRVRSPTKLPFSLLKTLLTIKVKIYSGLLMAVLNCLS